MIQELRKVIRRLHYLLEVMLVWVGWYAAYPLSLRHIEEMTAERGVSVDHATVHRWSIKILLVLATVFRRRKRPGFCRNSGVIPNGAGDRPTIKRPASRAGMRRSKLGPWDGRAVPS